MSKMDALQSALKTASDRNTAPPPVKKEREEPPAGPQTVARKPPASTATSRAGRENIAAWLPPGFKKSIRLVQAKMPNDPPLQALMAEAFNDLFVKYNVPTVSED